MPSTGQDLVRLLKKLYGVHTASELAKAMNQNIPTVTGWDKSKKKNFTAREISNMIQKVIKKEKNRIDGQTFITAAKKKYNHLTDASLTEKLGISTVSNWKKYGLTSRKIIDALEKSNHQHVAGLIQPIAEFYPIHPTKSKQGKKLEIVGADTKSQTTLKEALKSYSGIYVFYDSSGKALYVGKAETQNLWKEMNLAFNRKRENQIIKKVHHPVAKDVQTFKSSARKITKSKVYLHDLAHYFSAYSVQAQFIAQLEATLIRLFPNDLLNARVESHKKKPSTAKK